MIFPACRKRRCKLTFDHFPGKVTGFNWENLFCHKERDTPGLLHTAILTETAVSNRIAYAGEGTDLNQRKFLRAAVYHRSPKSLVEDFKEQTMHEELFEAMAQSIIDGEPEVAERLAQQGVEQGVNPLDAINRGFVVGVNQVGEDFGCGRTFLPNLVMAGEAMKAAIAVLQPELSRLGTQRQVSGRVVLGTVDGDIHEIGKMLVGIMLTANGFEVYDLGVDVPAERFIEKAREVNADIIGLSALLTTTMIQQENIIRALTESGLRPPIKVMVGGAPVTRSWADEIGADGYSEDALGAVKVAKALVGEVS
jgi:corrinoid protein of di/trimethylamine methyltransferase